MPKLKIHKTATKRFRVTGSGKIFRSPGSVSHLRAKESVSEHKRKQGLRAVGKTNLKRVRKLINR